MSPIAGLTDRGKNFMRLARVKKGEVVEKDGKKYPKDLDYFRITYSDGCEDVRKAFENLYGLKPTTIDIRLPFADVSECWNAYLTCYGKGGRIASASTFVDEDGKEYLRWESYRDPATMDVWVRNGRSVGPNGEAFMAKPFDPKDVVYTYKNEKSEMVDVFLKPEGRLSFVAPRLAHVDGKP